MAPVRKSVDHQQREPQLQDISKTKEYHVMTVVHGICSIVAADHSLMGRPFQIAPPRHSPRSPPLHALIASRKPDCDVVILSRRTSENLKSFTESGGARLQPTTAVFKRDESKFKTIWAKTDFPLCHQRTRAAWQCCPGLMSQLSPCISRTPCGICPHRRVGVLQGILRV